MKIFCIILLIFIACTSTTIQAQITGNNETELLKPFRAKLAKSKKFESKPHLPQLDSNSNKNQQYLVPAHLLSLQYPAPVIRPLAMPKAKQEKAYSFYAKAAIGYPLSPLAEISYNALFDAFKLDVHAAHHSIIQGYFPNQSFSKTQFDVNGTYFTKKSLAVGGRFEINYNTNRFYGFLDSLESISISDDSMRQRFLDIQGNIHLFNAKVAKIDLNYRGDVDFYVYSDNFGSSEFSITPSFSLEKWFGKSKEKHPLVLDIGLNYLSFKDLPVTIDSVTTTSSKNLLLFYFHPTFTVNAGAFKARLGVNLGVNNRRFFIHPDVELSYALAKGVATIYAGANGQVRQNNFRSLSRYNPFLVSNPDIRHSNYLEFFGGARGSVKKITYDIRAGYTLTQDLPFFMNDRDSLSQFSRFRPVYDTCNIIFVRGNLDFRLIKNLLIGGTIGYNIYQTRQFEKAFHLPTFESNFFVQYDLYLSPKGKQTTKSKDRKVSNYLSFRGELFVNAGIPYLNENSETKLLQGLYDFSFNVRYQATKNIAVFADLNNIIHNQNQRWYLYRQVGFNGMLGLEVKF